MLSRVAGTRAPSAKVSGMGTESIFSPMARAIPLSIYIKKLRPRYYKGEYKTGLKNGYGVFVYTDETNKKS